MRSWCAGSRRTCCRPRSATAWACPPTARSPRPAVWTLAQGCRYADALSAAAAPRRAVRHVAAGQPVQARDRRRPGRAGRQVGDDTHPDGDRDRAQPPGCDLCDHAPRTAAQLDSQLAAAEVTPQRERARRIGSTRRPTMQTSPRRRPRHRQPAGRSARALHAGEDRARYRPHSGRTTFVATGTRYLRGARGAAGGGGPDPPPPSRWFDHWRL